MIIRNFWETIHNKWVDADETVKGRTAQCAIILIVLGALAYIGLTIAASKHLEIDWSNKTVDICVGSAGALVLGAMFYRIYSTPQMLTIDSCEIERNSISYESCQGNKSSSVAEDRPSDQVHLVIQDPPVQKTVVADRTPQNAGSFSESRLEHAETQMLTNSQLDAAYVVTRNLAKEKGAHLEGLNTDYDVYRSFHRGDLSSVYLQPPTQGAKFNIGCAPIFKQVRTRFLSKEG